jgi:hypothetical protein
MQNDYAKFMQNDYAKIMQNDYANSLGRMIMQSLYKMFMQFMHRLHCRKRKAYRQAVGLKLSNHILIAYFNQDSKGYHWVLNG